MFEELIKFLKTKEGFRSTSYVCPGNVLSVGYGFTKWVYPGMIISHAEAEKLMKIDLYIVSLMIDKLVKVPLKSCERAALMSFVFNVGPKAFKRSTMLKKINAKANNMEIADELYKWNKSNGRVHRGLTIRREQERDIYLGRRPGFSEGN